MFPTVSPPSLPSLPYQVWHIKVDHKLFASPATEKWSLIFHFLNLEWPGDLLDQYMLQKYHSGTCAPRSKNFTWSTQDSWNTPSGGCQVSSTTLRRPHRRGHIWVPQLSLVFLPPPPWHQTCEPSCPGHSRPAHWPAKYNQVTSISEHRTEKSSS